MEAHLSQWLNLALRWTHVITGIAWIGTSFYFNWLNSRIAAPERAEPGVKGELWSVHGGAFYRTVKYAVAPERLPRTLHWFKWEAYATWLTGFALLVLIYYWQAEVYLLEGPNGPVGPAAGIAIGLGALVGAWLLYDGLCRSPLGSRPVALTVVGLLLAAAAAYWLVQLLSPRAAFMHIGAMLGTIMAANVFRVIIPSQREMVSAMQEGRPPDAALGRQAALRSLHNNYLTLPVLFIMVSGHYPATFGHPGNWAILAALAVIGAGTRHYFNLRNQGRRNVWVLPLAAVGIVVLAVATGPRRESATGTGTAPGLGRDGAGFSDVRVVIAQRCAGCHSSAPSDPAFATAPLGVELDTPQQIQSQAARIHAVAVATQTMPLGNLTGMTQDERELLRRWIAGGARLR